MVVVLKEIDARYPPFCEAEVEDKMTRAYRIKRGESLKCSRLSRYLFEDKVLCGPHCGPRVIAALLREST